MESFFVRFKNPLLLVALLLAQTIGLAIQVRRPATLGASLDNPAATDSRSISLVRYWVVSIITPFERLFHGIGFNVRDGWSNYVDLRHVRQQNFALRQQLADMRLQQAAIAQDALQGQRLQALLAFQQHYVARTVAAQVIGTSGSDLSRVLWIDKGSKDGLKPDDAVITPDGIVGKLRDVFPHTAQVLLIDDQTSGAGVMLASTRIRAIVRGTAAGRIVINNLTADSRIKPGETVLTSGGDQVFPRGLPVGTIESIVPDPDHQPYTLISVRPAGNLTQLEEVLIITATQPDLPTQARQDLVLGAATATAAAQAAEAKALIDAARAAELKALEDAKSAAEIVADRLPSLHGTPDPNVPNPSGSKTAIDPNSPTGKVQHPPPTLRPDRYTPGATPSAADLTPGSTSTKKSAPKSTPPPTEPPPNTSN